MITVIKKRDGREIHFSPEKITRAIFLAASHVAQDSGEVADYATAERLCEQVVGLLNNCYQDKVPSVEEVQDMVVKVLIENGHVFGESGAGYFRMTVACPQSMLEEGLNRIVKAIKELTDN